MYNIETPVDLAQRIKLASVPDILGFALWYEKGEKAGFIQKFKFRFDAVKPDNNSFSFSVLKTPSNKTPADHYVYDLDTAILIQSAFKWFTEVSPQIHYIFYIQENGKSVLQTSLVQLESNALHKLLS